MRIIVRALGIAVGGCLIALFLYIMLALPGVLSDRDSIVALTAMQTGTSTTVGLPPTGSLNIDSEKQCERTVRNPNRKRIDLPHRRRPAARVRRSAPAALPRPCPGRTGCGVGRCSAHE